MCQHTWKRTFKKILSRTYWVILSFDQHSGPSRYFSSMLPYLLRTSAFFIRKKVNRIHGMKKHAFSIWCMHETCDNEEKIMWTLRPIRYAAQVYFKFWRLKRIKYLVFKYSSSIYGSKLKARRSKQFCIFHGPQTTVDFTFNRLLALKVKAHCINVLQNFSGFDSYNLLGFDSYFFFLVFKVSCKLYGKCTIFIPSLLFTFIENKFYDCSLRVAKTLWRWGSEQDKSCNSYIMCNFLVPPRAVLRPCTAVLQLCTKVHFSVRAAIPDGSSRSWPYHEFSRTGKHRLVEVMQVRDACTGLVIFLLLWHIFTLHLVKLLNGATSDPWFSVHTLFKLLR